MSSAFFPPPGRHDSHAKDPYPDGSHSHGYTRSTIEMPSIICGLDGRVVWANDAWVRLSGFSRVEILAFDHLVQLHGPRTDPVAVRALMQQVARSQPCSAHLVCYDRSGLPFAHTLRVVPLHAFDGSPRLFRLTSDAVTHNPYECAAHDAHRTVTAIPKQSSVYLTLTHSLVPSISLSPSPGGRPRPRRRREDASPRRSSALRRPRPRQARSIASAPLSSRACRTAQSWCSPSPRC